MTKHSYLAKLNRDLKKLGIRYAGPSFFNIYFIKIFTGRLSIEIFSYNLKEYAFSDEDQMKLQKEYYSTLYHEFIHYIHDVSTMLGTGKINFSFLKKHQSSSFPNIEQDKLPTIGTHFSL